MAASSARRARGPKMSRSSSRSCSSPKASACRSPPKASRLPRISSACATSAAIPSRAICSASLSLTSGPTRWCSGSARASWRANLFLDVAFGEELVGADGKFRPVAHSQLVEHRVKIDFHGAFGDAQLLRDLAVAKPLADEAHQLTLARRKRGSTARSKGLGQLLDSLR